MCRIRAIHGLDWSGQRTTGQFLPSTFRITPVRTVSAAHNRWMSGAHPPSFSDRAPPFASVRGGCSAFAPPLTPASGSALHFPTPVLELDRSFTQLGPGGSPGSGPDAGRRSRTERRPAEARVCVIQPPPRITRMRGPGSVRPGRVVARRLLVVVLVVSVPAPLPDVAEHVVEAEPVRKLLPHRVGQRSRNWPRTRHALRGPRDRPRTRIPTRPPSADGIPTPSSPAPGRFPHRSRRTAFAPPARSACCRT